MSEAAVTIQPYSDKNILVQGDYNTYAKQMKRFQSRWNSRLKSGPGWLVPLEFESAVRAYFGMEDADEAPAPKYKPAPKKPAAKKPAPPKKELEEVPEDQEAPQDEDVHEHSEHEEHDEEPEEPEEKPAPKKPIPKKVAPKKPIPKVEDPKDDVASLAGRMKEMMLRLDKLEKK